MKEMDYEKNRDRNDEIYSKVVKAGKRTYFFDIKSTKGNDLYITLTESKKVFDNGQESFQKHKIFLYKEDFEKFKDGFDEVLAKMEELRSDETSQQAEKGKDEVDSFTFESL